MPYKYAIMAALMLVIGLYPIAASIAAPPKMQAVLNGGSHNITHADTLLRLNIACSENDIHRETVNCYNDCVSHYADEQAKQECIQSCVNTQNTQRAKCGVRCKNVAGYNICE
jgi:hypothetical protein